ncbi:hypothetical protein FDP41_012410 [Naegleria fowleri]|uniref:Uncharacterized protein n=1 Tax=Naegleria fowleri TaxID=5763 RepID=A0A6A5BUJ1_NAEFO|nr:uncharacterized protein FDP41_012410 [Naegleria fowleri]KAF0981753.1 hypothetical protein FDP41_012410 [Naegleria fowleri]CAG4711606.1 unnamed protein product [Naegleria fowleri]
MTIKPYVFTAGAVSALGFALHVSLGGKHIVTPLLKKHEEKQLNERVVNLLHACWHITSLSLAASTAVLLSYALGRDYLMGKSIKLTPELIEFVSELNLGAALVVLDFSLFGVVDQEKEANLETKQVVLHRLTRFPQWMAFGVIGLLPLIEKK